MDGWINVPTWQFPPEPSPAPTSFESGQTPEYPQQAGESDTAPPPKRHYPIRVCRICLESVPPTFVPPSEHMPEFFQREPRVVYESSDPELGRLLRPCKCKGSSRYVHEGCLQSWRHADPSYGQTHYWNCPTCGFQYRLERLIWARWISSTLSQIMLTCFVLVFTIFVLGFIADPIINLYVDPMETIYYSEYWEGNSLSDSEPASWFEHLVKGMASLGLLSFLQVIYGFSPLRFTTIGRGRGNTGRSRTSSLSWFVIALGICSFLWAVYKGVRAWSRRTLVKAGDRVMDVPLPDDEADEEEEPERPKTE
ncbi:hypothetical protein BJX63DRAFT_271791 [Aspergillus granulosus]|uniref:RING-CH-type domain-containing protein n=1 Tax=Aspergillus granulosus TaxID=176169 RepID=A0ABR4H8B4_9EURO